MTLSYYRKIYLFIGSFLNGSSLYDWMFEASSADLDQVWCVSMFTQRGSIVQYCPLGIHVLGLFLLTIRSFFAMFGSFWPRQDKTDYMYMMCYQLRSVCTSAQSDQSSMTIGPRLSTECKMMIPRRIWTLGRCVCLKGCFLTLRPIYFWMGTYTPCIHLCQKRFLTRNTRSQVFNYLRNHKRVEIFSYWFKKLRQEIKTLCSSICNIFRKFIWSSTEFHLSTFFKGGKKHSSNRSWRTELILRLLGALISTELSHYRLDTGLQIARY